MDAINATNAMDAMNAIDALNLTPKGWTLD